MSTSSPGSYVTAQAQPLDTVEERVTQEDSITSGESGWLFLNLLSLGNPI